MNVSLKHTFLLVILSLLWAGTFIFVKIADASLDPLTIMAIRAICSAVFLFIILNIMRRPLKKYFKNFRYQCICLGTGILIAYMWLTIGYSEQVISAGMGSLLITALVIFSWLITTFVTHDKPFYSVNLIGIIVATLGIAMMLGFNNIFHGNSNLWFALLYISGLAVFATAAALNKKLLQGIDPFITTAFNLFYMAIVLVIAAFIFAKPLADHFSVENLSAVLALGIFSTAVGYMLFFYLVNNAGLLFASFNSYLVPIFGFIMGILLLNERASLEQFIGLLIVFIGMYLVQKTAKLRQVNAE